MQKKVAKIYDITQLSEKREMKTFELRDRKLELKHEL
jgi:hypothetical protein